MTQAGEKVVCGMSVVLRMKIGARWALTAYQVEFDDLTDPGGRGSRALDSLGRPATTEK